MCDTTLGIGIDSKLHVCFSVTGVVAFWFWIGVEASLLNTLCCFALKLAILRTLFFYVAVMALWGKSSSLSFTGCSFLTIGVASHDTSVVLCEKKGTLPSFLTTTHKLLRGAGVSSE